MPSSATTTFSDLTADAALQLRQAHPLTRPRLPLDGTALLDALTAHRDLSHGLATLGRALATTGARASVGGPARARGATELLLRRIELRAAARPWDAGDPEGPCAGLLLGSARLIRAAADLWATHHTADGTPRSPEAGRMRHPSVLGAVWREWHALAGLAADVADDLDETAGALNVAAGLRSAVAAYPRSPEGTAGTAPAAVRLPVAHPPLPASRQPLVELDARLGRLHTLAWDLAHRGRAPAHVLRILAAIGAAVSSAAAACGEGPGAQRTGGQRPRTTPESARAGAWQAVVEALDPIQTLHESRTSLQLERLRIVRLLECVPTGSPLRHDAAPSLSNMAEAYAQLATMNVRGLRRAHERGDVLVMGRAIPGNIIGRRRDLLHAKLLDTAVPAPTACIELLERRYDDVVTAIPSDSWHPSAGPPAA